MPSSSPSRHAALTVFSAAVLAAAAVAVGLLVWATAVPKNLVQWVAVALGWTLVAALAPRRPDPGDTVRLEADSFPGTHALVESVATEVGVEPPAAVHVSIDFDARVVGTGWTRRPALVVGLPLWTCLTDDERLALLAHELGLLRHTGSARGHLVGLAHGLLERLAAVLVPLGRDEVSDLEDTRFEVARSNAIMNGLGRAVLRLVSVPPVLLLRAFERTASREGHARVHAADLDAARVAGTPAVVRLLLTLMGVPGLHTRASAAVRRRDDPFESLAEVRERPAPTAGAVAHARTRARTEDLRRDAAQPRGDLRLSELEAHPAEPDGDVLQARRSLVQAADAELAGLRETLRRPLRDELLETWM